MTEPVASARRAASGATIAGFVISVIAVVLTVIGGGVIPGIVAMVLLVIGGRRGRTALGTAGSFLAVLAVVGSLLVAIARVNAGGV